MRRIKQIFQAGSAVIVLAGLLAASQPAPIQAETANMPSLIISQLKLTSSNGQFVTLYNAGSSTLDMTKYQLEYFNNYDLSKSTSSRLISLTGSLPPHSYYMINDDALLLCYRLMVDSQSLGLSTTSGFLEVLAYNQSSPGASASPILQDFVGWSKTAATGAQTLSSNTSAFLQRQPVDANGSPSINLAGNGTWLAVQPDPNNACNLVAANNNLVTVNAGPTQLLPSIEPTATIISAGNNTVAKTSPSLPTSDIGLMAPQLTELLPNPSGTGNDKTDEFIELYNPNSISFDLTGFALQVGATTTHNYTFASGTLAPHGFQAFYSSVTGLSLSNTVGQAKLLDPFGNSISATASYGTAKDGEAWALANGKWYWTTKPTPNAANIINMPPAKKTSTKSATSKQHAAKTRSGKTKTSNSNSAFAAQDTAKTAAVHPRLLALVVIGALLYGAYEYRADLANQFFVIRQYFANRRTDRA